jgi:hypothetical protein
LVFVVKLISLGADRDAFTIFFLEAVPTNTLSINHRTVGRTSFGSIVVVVAIIGSYHGGKESDSKNLLHILFYLGF